ncbi:MAG: CocE/NonD family hydrolase, partial [Bacteroidota bacterium]|nr:CocE/NonD family hydrolase [Bacteroidota bacterium]
NIQFGSNTSGYYQQHFEIPFFNYFLKGIGDISQIGEANVFVTGANEWKTFSEWPPANAQEKAIYLQPDGKLGWSKPTAANSFSEYISDPAKPVPYEEFVHFNRTRTYMSDDQRFAARRPDVLVFQTDTLSDAVTIAGNIMADIMTSISTTDADFVVKLIDVFPENMGYNQVNIYAENDPDKIYPMGGYQMLVRAEIMRGKFRNSFSKPEPFVPGEITEVKWELPDVAHTFLKGHRIMIQIQSSWFPLADRNPQKFLDIYNADAKDFQKATVHIYHDAQHPSKIILPVLKK